MGAGGGLVAGSGKDFIIINTNDCERQSPVQELGGGICQICGENIEVLEFSNNKEFFVACNECAFPVCRPCYEYERREGDQACPQCKTRYKRHKGSARVIGDEDEDEADDLDHEFSNADWNFYASRFNVQNNSEWSSHCNMGTSISDPYHPSSNSNTSLPRMTYAGEDDDPDHHALVVHTNSGDFTNQVLFQGSCTPLQPRPLNPSRDISLYGYGSVAWKNRLEGWKRRQLDLLHKAGAHDGAFQGNSLNFKGNAEEDAGSPKMDEARQPLSRKLPIASKNINPYRIIIILRLIILGFFFHYRLLNPVKNAYALWLTSVICEIWFAISWILDQFQKWCPIERETFLDRLSLRYEKEEQNQLADIDIFVSMMDPKKEDTLVTVNTVLSILAVDYPADKVSCYASDDGAAMLTFEALSETSLFAKKWAPFCKKFSIEPRAPECYFKQKMDYLKGKVDPAFVGERRAIKREYEEFKIRINGLISMSKKVPEQGWTMQHGTPWPGNDSQDHPGMVQVFLGPGDSLDVNGDNLPRLVYVSRERKPGFNNHKNAGAMNAMMRVSGVLSNAPFILNLNYNHYINNSKALREAMCFMMDPSSGSKICFVQFPYKFDKDDQHYSYSDRVDFYNITMKGLDGIQGPIYLGTGCVFRRQALYGAEAPMKEKTPRNDFNCWPKGCSLYRSSKKKIRKGETKKSRKDGIKKSREIPTQVHSLETILEEVEGEDLEMSSLVPFEMLKKKYGLSPAFVASTLRENGRTSKFIISASALEEALQVISCGYEDKTAWGKEVGWIYGSVREGVATSFKMHCNGWRSVYCMPRRPAFKGSAPTNLSDHLYLVLCRALGSVEILLSKHCPIWHGYGGGMKCLQRFSYMNLVLCPWTALPLVTYCILPAFCLMTGNFFIPEVSIYSSIIFMTLFASIIVASVLEIHWGRLALDDWWRNEQFWVISNVSSHLFALFNGILEVIIGMEAKFFLKCAGNTRNSAEPHRSMWSSLLIPPMTVLILNIIGIISGISDAISGSYDAWGPLFGKVFFATWVIVHLYPFLKGMMGKQNRVPTIIVVWSILLASVCSLLWVRLNPFVFRSEGPVLEICGLDCD